MYWRTGDGQSRNELESPLVLVWARPSISAKGVWHDEDDDVGPWVTNMMTEVMALIAQAAATTAMLKSISFLGSAEFPLGLGVLRSSF